jgi:glyoxylate/hydroxypyruvate reductase
MSTQLKVLVCSYFEESLIERIRLHEGIDVINVPELLPVPRFPCDHHGAARELSSSEMARWKELMATAEVCLDFDWSDPISLPLDAPRLRWIQATSSGIGAFMTSSGLASSDVLVSTAAGIHATPLAEWVLTGVLHFVKGVPDLLDGQRAHRWERTAVRSLAGKRAIIVGLGNVGRAAGAALRALGVEIWGAGRPGHTYETPGFSRFTTTDRLAEVLPECDIVVLACPLTSDTVGLLGAEEIALLSREAIIVNVSRGQVINEEALIDALEHRRLCGAALDVAATEPLPVGSKLWDLDNVLICPHSASTLTTENEALTDLFLDNLDRFLTGMPLHNLYQADRGY